MIKFFKRLLRFIGILPPAAPRLGFKGVYKRGGFGGAESLSGTGSTLEQTRVLREELPKVFKAYAIKSILDIPCGDFNWMQHLDLSSVAYTGCDIVPQCIADNRQKYGERYNFIVGDLCQGPIPQIDLIFCRDCLVHMPFVDIQRALRVVVSSGSSWLMLTTFTQLTANEELGSPRWRPLNMQLSPFYFPAPDFLLNEQCTENDGAFADKSIGLWRIDRLAECSQFTR